ncbi:hypothetical protein MTR67_029554 [Solanum verrucosum]|uniref:Uncharacterized protein n=1 Tax=Solanum verrucosum TaxID=315347 RepID=A0AAF0RCY2_SOLVR|nr:hypothetical protein MTR67_029554 [Solanum verrucosum]
MVVLLWCIRHSSEHPEDSSLLFRLLDLGIGRTDFSVCCRLPDGFKLLPEQVQAELVLVHLKRFGVDYHIPVQRLNVLL